MIDVITITNVKHPNKTKQVKSLDLLLEMSQGFQVR